jgi:heptosyltransferase-1
MEKILIVRLSAMGDLINSLPVAAALRKAMPAAIIDWAVEERWAELLCALGTAHDSRRSPQKPLVDTIYTVNTRRWRDHPFAKRTRDDIFALRRRIREAEYSRVIDVQGAIRSAVIARFSKSARIVGFEKPREPQAKCLFSERVPARGTHIIEQNVSLTGLPVPAADTEMLPHDPAAEKWRDEVLQRRLGDRTRYAVLSPGAGWGAKEWAPERYGEVAGMLAKDGIVSLVNCGPKEVDLAKTVEAASGGSAQPISCTISQLVALLRKASLFVGGDTGPMHLANLIQVPLVAVFGPTNPARNGPFYPPFEVVRHESSATDYSHKSTEHEGLANTTAAEVYEAARRILKA